MEGRLQPSLLCLVNNLFQPAGRDVKWCSHCRKQLGSAAEKLNLESLYDPAVPLMGLYPKELKTDMKTSACT